MTINVIDALMHIKDDEKWVKKIAIASSIMLLGIIAYFLAILVASYEVQVASIMFGVIAVIIGLYVTGFVVSTANKAMNSDEFKLAELNEKNLMLKGLHYGLSAFGYSVIWFIIAFVITFFISFSVGFVYGLGGESVGNIFAAGFSIISIILLIPLVLYFSMFVLIAYSCYLKNLKFVDFIAIYKHFVILKNNHKTCWTLLGHQFLYAILFSVIISILPITIVGILFVPYAFLGAYIWCNNILVQFAKEIEIEKYLVKKQ